MQDFSKFLIKNYKYWELQLRENQTYLGHCIAWCKVPDIIDPTELGEEAWQELLFVLSDAKVAIKKTFNPDKMNYAFLGNNTEHLHGQIIPRYKEPRIFEGQKFTDPRWGQNYLMDPDFKIDDQVLNSILDKLKINI